MLSKNTLKFIKSLQQKKFRKQEHAFFVEGSKNVTELLDSDFEITHILYTQKFADEHPNALRGFKGESFLVTQNVLQSAGSFQSNDAALAVAKIVENQPPIISKNELTLVLDDVRDPGNLGTIIRIADWYGIKNIVCSNESADFYNPKVLNSSMGSFTRVSVSYTDVYNYLLQVNLPIYGAFLDGKNIHQSKFSPSGVIVMGNESNGISDQIGSLVTDRITIPRFGDAESLNVAIATAIICDNFKRS
ncbi:RNA methyltransferase [Belliella aquatica]|uniref:RNA methyltransferase n=1 Tax=Belliella aquatica TaxID=1323734 RepID=A0ABQ1LY86_9BACT|nr:RNA methyltransferase [Belliella aquatica]MCH7405870.1 RNA methyltransferase [Belliella aquatica]GGC30062.1 RNA methyltransferase [Belliella aquatica]